MPSADHPPACDRPSAPEIAQITVHTELGAEAFDVLDYSRSLDENLVALAAVAERMLEAEHCTITLFRQEGPSEVEPSVRTHFCGRANPGQSAPHRAAGSADSADDGPLAPAAPGSRIMCSPISVDGELLGLIKVRDPRSKPSFDLQDLNLLQVLALFISKSLQVVQLRNVLKSRFAQLALIRDVDDIAGDVLVRSAQNPEQIVKIVVKSFYREMTAAGFGPKQILHAASEIINELTKSLRRHSKRIESADKQQSAEPELEMLPEERA